jgi:hypothetical protein
MSTLIAREFGMWWKDSVETGKHTKTCHSAVLKQSVMSSVTCAKSTCDRYYWYLIVVKTLQFQILEINAEGFGVTGLSFRSAAIP